MNLARILMLAGITFTLPVSRAAIASGQWSKYPACEDQFNRDRVVCQRVKIAACWASQMERLAYCNRTKGETGKPPLAER